jgi:metal transporter CNNM
MLMYCKHPLIFIEDTVTLDVALNEFKTGKSHMAIVRQIYDDGEVDKYYEAIGVVTLEDVIEEVLQTEINDETDTLSDNRRKRRRVDAQVAHLVDELITDSPTKPALMGPSPTLSPPQQQPLATTLNMLSTSIKTNSNNQSST